MALNTDALKEDLKAAYELARNSESDGEDSLNQFCGAIALAFEKYVKTAQVVYTQGLLAPNGPVTGTFNHTIQ